jgi:hypothetical protein
MSGLTNMMSGRKQTHRQLLATVSAAALLGFMAVNGACAADADKPVIWLDASGQLDQLSDKQSNWVPDFMSGPNIGPLSGMFQDLQRTPRYGYDGTASLSFRPGDDGWVLSGSIRMGRARQLGGASKLAHIRRQIWSTEYPSHYGVLSHETESHLFVDFSVGKDVGLGIAGTESTISAGVRFANLRSRSDVQISSNFPPSLYGSSTNRPDTRIKREFRGWGPKIAWDGSAAVAGALEDGQLGINWGLNAALLFGRQTTKQKIDAFYRQHYVNWASYSYVTHTQNLHSQNERRKNVTVPALGGYLAASYRVSNAKISLGYRADWYFNALDGGVTASQKVNRGFFGPYASISIGIGD